MNFSHPFPQRAKNQNPQYQNREALSFKLLTWATQETPKTQPIIVPVVVPHKWKEVSPYC